MGEVGSLTFNGASNTVVGCTGMGEVGAHNRGARTWTRRQDHWSEKKMLH